MFMLLNFNSQLLTHFRPPWQNCIYVQYFFNFFISCAPTVRLRLNYGQTRKCLGVWFWQNKWLLADQSDT